jgi:NADPH:quinone reductase-like Zn-dependent oxidoreductase
MPLSRYRLKPVIDTEFPFTEAAAAYQHFASRSHMGKVVIVADQVLLAHCAGD